MSYSGKCNHSSKEFIKFLILLAEIFRILNMQKLSKLMLVIIHLRF